jgi:hypothetical protein
VLGEKSFDGFFSELLQNIVEHQQQKIETVFWNLNDYLVYVVFVLLF